MDYYILSQKAQEDIEATYDFGFRRFGKEQALYYLTGMQSHFELLLKNSGIGKQRDEIKKGLYSIPYASHVIFFRILKNHIRIVRVLHGSRDLKKFLK